MKHKRNLDWLLDLPAGWALIYTSLIADLEKLDPNVKVDQAKQKFGELRVYLARGSDEAYDLIEAATRASRAIVHVDAPRRHQPVDRPGAARKVTLCHRRMLMRISVSILRDRKERNAATMVTLSQISAGLGEGGP